MKINKFWLKSIFLVFGLTNCLYAIPPDKENATELGESLLKQNGTNTSSAKQSGFTDWTRYHRSAHSYSIDLKENARTEVKSERNGKHTDISSKRVVDSRSVKITYVGAQQIGNATLEESTFTISDIYRKNAHVIIKIKEETHLTQNLTKNEGFCSCCFLTNEIPAFSTQEDTDKYFKTYTVGLILSPLLIGCCIMYYADEVHNETRRQNEEMFERKIISAYIASLVETADKRVNERISGAPKAATMK